MDKDISMDIHAKICGYGYGYGWEFSYPRQAWISGWGYVVPTVIERRRPCLSGDVTALLHARGWIEGMEEKVMGLGGGGMRTDWDMVRTQLTMIK